MKLIYVLAGLALMSPADEAITFSATGGLGTPVAIAQGPITFVAGAYLIYKGLIGK